jgi:hypothetical protein
MATESILIWMAPDMKAIGKKINSMEKAKKHGLMELSTMEIM